ncbi:conserved exported hypothetical protein [Burkholderiales bacterium]|nr:conserved exported hypothetical protein [Burkholderiales bacterium]
MRQGIVAAAAAVLAACSPPTESMAYERAGTWHGANLADVQLLDRDTGERLPIYWHDGQRWIAGTPGHRYEVSVRNTTPGRILGVVSVDGINAVSGETADWSQRGYVLAPWQAFDVLGWRKSQSQVADFVFTALDDSYAARTGRPDNAGVIGVAVFREAVRPPAPPTSVSRARPSGEPGSEEGAADRAVGGQGPASAGAMAKAAPGALLQEQRLGTGHGPAETSVVSTTSFDRAQEHPDQVIEIRYERRERLVAMGVIPAPSGPRPFPGSAESGFVPDPPDRLR